ncbi:hypothetical protein EV667_4213 [Ancylobacter aquaticus]|uniref:DUF3137 domain-containing protein n=1 Tax=Ancylobacter aquaticus TaxID=100 RepID=A0A4R1HH49_ANCAQ|nr:hypothetical protein [Ancylobacter aquaticus]TCK19755.1 hypothetical protein EV667_4213 [Ancylobacter aquaticus]
MSMEGAGGWSILGIVARFRGPPRGMLFGNLGRPRLLEFTLPTAQARAATERTKPVIARLNEQRQAHFDATETQLRLKMGGAAAAGLVLGWLFMGSLPIGLALMVGGAFFAFLMLSAKADYTARADAKHAIVEAMAEGILGLTSVPPDQRAAALPQGLVESWRLLPPVRTITVDDWLAGETDDCRIAVFRAGFQFGGSSNVVLKPGDGLVFVIVEIAEADATESVSDDDLTLVLGTDAPLMLRSAPRITHGLTKSQTGDAAFDALYEVFGDAARLTPKVRASFRALEAVTRCDRTGTREVPAGAGLRAAVVLRPGYLVVLTPVAVFDGALEPPPFWQPLAADTLIPAFASDLTILNEHLTAAMTLRGELS